MRSLQLYADTVSPRKRPKNSWSNCVFLAPQTSPESRIVWSLAAHRRRPHALPTSDNQGERMAGHILRSKRIADDLAHDGWWHPYLHQLGECSVKHGSDCLYCQSLQRLHNRLQILIRDRLDNVPTFVEHLNVASAITHTFLSIIKRVLSACFSAIDRANALFLPSRVTPTQLGFQAD
jgi:hypothetical protein